MTTTKIHNIFSNLTPIDTIKIQTLVVTFLTVSVRRWIRVRNVRIRCASRLSECYSSWKDCLWRVELEIFINK